MFNKQIWGWLVVGLSLWTSSASAAIPDANGVFHGCYNVLSGSMRLIDGTSCNLLERHVTWQQQGPTGPQGVPGPQGPQGPQGPAGDSKVSVGYAGFFIEAPNGAPAHTTVWIEESTFTPTGPGTCVVNVHAFIDSAPGRYDMFLVYSNHEGSEVLSSINQTGFSGQYGRLSARVSSGVPFDVGPPGQSTVRFGVYIQSWDTPFAPNAVGEGAINWVCKYD